MERLILTFIICGLLAACNDAGADANGDGKITPDEVSKEIDRVELEPGQWENRVEIVDVKIAGLPPTANLNEIEKLKGSVRTTLSCITPEQAKNPGAEFFAAQEKAINCDVDKFDMRGGSVNSVLSCSNLRGIPGDIKLTMTGQYGPSSYDMQLNTQGGVAGMQMNIIAKNSGNRVGECPKG